MTEKEVRFQQFSSIISHGAPKRVSQTCVYGAVAKELNSILRSYKLKSMGLKSCG